jgi:hypothetical protein
LSSYGPPGGGIFELIPTEGPIYLNINSDAEFTGSVEICVVYDPEYVSPEQESDLVMLHYEDGDWIDITSSLDVGSNTLCGITTGFSPFVMGVEKATDISQQISNEIPSQYKLSQNYPNPFNPSTNINFSLPRLSNVDIKIYNILGQVVRNLVNEEKPAGEYNITWDGKDNAGKSVASGIYLYKIKTDNFSSSKKMLLMK